MKANNIIIIGIINILLICYSFAGGGVGVKVSTLGPGCELTLEIIEWLNIRGGFYAFKYDVTKEDITVDMDFSSVAALLDFHPLYNNFKITTGIMFNDNSVKLSADLKDSVEINETEYWLKSIDGSISFDKTMPYIGIGFGNAADKNTRINFSFDLGVLYMKAPRVKLKATASNPFLQDELDKDVEEEKEDIQKELNNFRFYPYLAFGISIRF